MKKLSLVLALILVLTCGVLAACNDEGAESSVAESVEESTATSTEESTATSTEESTATSTEESTATSTEESSEAVSEEESSEVVEESIPEAEKPEISGDNIAEGKSYTISGCGKGYDNYTANLTDGSASAVMAYDNTWFAFYCNDGAAADIVSAPNKVGYVIIDLGEATDVSAVRINCINVSGSGIVAPASIKVSLSTDGTTFTNTVSMPIDTADGAAYWSEGAIEGNAQYVKVEVTLTGTFAFLNEIEVYA